MSFPFSTTNMASEEFETVLRSTRMPSLIDSSGGLTLRPSPGTSYLRYAAAAALRIVEPRTIACCSDGSCPACLPPQSVQTLRTGVSSSASSSLQPAKSAQPAALRAGTSTGTSIGYSVIPFEGFQIDHPHTALYAQPYLSPSGLSSVEVKVGHVEHRKVTDWRHGSPGTHNAIHALIDTAYHRGPDSCHTTEDGQVPSGTRWQPGSYRARIASAAASIKFAYERWWTENQHDPRKQLDPVDTIIIAEPMWRDAQF